MKLDRRGLRPPACLKSQNRFCCRRAAAEKTPTKKSTAGKRTKFVMLSKF